MTIRGTNGYFGRAAFTAYLKQLPPEEIVGERGLGHCCPITRFIQHLEPAALDCDTTLTQINYTIYRPGLVTDHRHQTPGWVYDFISHIDRRTLRDRFETSNSVTAAEALACLKQ